MTERLINNLGKLRMYTLYQTFKVLFKIQCPSITLLYRRIRSHDAQAICSCQSGGGRCFYPDRPYRNPSPGLLPNELWAICRYGNMRTLIKDY